jgi:hypothetical protein
VALAVHGAAATGPIKEKAAHPSSAQVLLSALRARSRCALDAQTSCANSDPNPPGIAVCALLTNRVRQPAEFALAAARDLHNGTRAPLRPQPDMEPAR